jgi:hypothetical protein
VKALDRSKSDSAIIGPRGAAIRYCDDFHYEGRFRPASVDRLRVAEWPLMRTWRAEPQFFPRNRLSAGLVPYSLDS